MCNLMIFVPVERILSLSKFIFNESMILIIEKLKLIVSVFSFMRKKECNTITEVRDIGEDSEYKSTQGSMVDLVAHIKPGEIFG